ncbi:unnamed protein product, partial [Staurois parvus]
CAALLNVNDSCFFIHHCFSFLTVCDLPTRRSYYSYSYYLKLAKKRKDAMGNTRQEMTHMVNAMDRSYADQSTLHAEDPLSITYMDSHNFTPRLPNDPLVPTAVLGEDLV